MRFNEKFEVKNEMSDREKLRPDDNQQFQPNGGKSSAEQQFATQEEANQTGGFDDMDDFEWDREYRQPEDWKTRMENEMDVRPTNNQGFPQTGGESSLEQQLATLEEANQTGGFDDMDDFEWDKESQQEGSRRR